MTGLGEQVAAPGVTLVDDPTNPLAFTATDVDGEGLAARRNVLLDDGVLKQFVHSSYSARRAGTDVHRQRRAGRVLRRHGRRVPRAATRARQPGCRTRSSPASTTASSSRACPGLHSGVNPVSGDFSTGASGMLITNGALGAPVREFTIASTLQRMLLDVAEVGADVDWLPMRAAGVSLVIHDVTMSGA